MDARPIFPSVHREAISPETLDDHDLDWSHDPHVKDYIIIKKHLTRKELEELQQHTAWLRERKERDFALRESEVEAERGTNLRGNKERSEPRRNSESGRGRHVERSSTRSGRVPGSGVHIHVNQTQNNHPPGPREALTSHPIPEMPSPSISRSQRPRAPSTHSRLSRPFDLHDFTPLEQPRQMPPQAHGLRSSSRAPRAPSELGVAPSRPARDPYDFRAGPPSEQEDPRAFAGAPGIGPAGRRLSHMRAPPEDVGFAPPPHREPYNNRPRAPSIQGDSGPFTGAPGVRPTGRRLSHVQPPLDDAHFPSPPPRQQSYNPRPRPPSVLEDPRTFAGAPGIRAAGRRLSHIRPPAEDGHFAPPSRAESLAGARSGHPRQAAGNAGQFPLQHAPGSIPPRRERSPDFVGRRSESRRGDTRAPGSRVEGRDGMGRQNSLRGYRANY